MRHCMRGGAVGILLALLLVVPAPVLAGHGRVVGKVHHGARSPVVVITTTPVFVPALGGGPVLRLDEVVIVGPPAVIVPHRGLIWVPGHWQWAGTAWVWIPGHWR